MKRSIVFLIFFYALFFQSVQLTNYEQVLVYGPCELIITNNLCDGVVTSFPALACTLRLRDNACNYNQDLPTNNSVPNSKPQININNDTLQFRTQVFHDNYGQYNTNNYSDLQFRHNQQRELLHDLNQLSNRNNTSDINEEDHIAVQIGPDSFRIVNKRDLSGYKPLFNLGKLNSYVAKSWVSRFFNKEFKTDPKHFARFCEPNFI